MWSLGCIMAEFLSKQPLFNGKTEFDQLDKVNLVTRVLDILSGLLTVHMSYRWFFVNS